MSNCSAAGNDARGQISISGGRGEGFSTLDCEFKVTRSWRAYIVMAIRMLVDLLRPVFVTQCGSRF